MRRLRVKCLTGAPAPHRKPQPTTSGLRSRTDSPGRGPAREHIRNCISPLWPARETCRGPTRFAQRRGQRRWRRRSLAGHVNPAPQCPGALCQRRGWLHGCVRGATCLAFSRQAAARV